MQAVQNLKEGIWNFPSTVNSFLGRDESAGGSSSCVKDIANTNIDSSSGTRADGAHSDTTDSGNEDDSNGNARSVSDEDVLEADSANSLHFQDDLANQSHAIPYTLIKEHWQLVLDQEATIAEMESAIGKCRDMVLRCEEGNEERKWLVRHLIELRHRLRELQDVDEDPDAVLSETKVILGHHFVKHKNCPKYKVYCDHCSGIIWNVVQASYLCTDCSFAVHHKCIRNVIRICAHVITAERNLPIECICPEIGLAFQKYTCAECGSQLSYNISTAVSCFGLELKAEKLNSIEPRLCDYSGLYYCPACHWNDTSIIPARVINNWDFVPRKVGRASLQQIRLLYDRPVINLEERNPRLFNFVQKLSIVKRLRQKLNGMWPYLTGCRIADELKLVRDNIATKRHLMQSVDMFSVADLVEVENGALPEFLRKVHHTFERHIRNCVICSGKAYICEVCNNDEVLFPFDDCAVSCARCNSVTHRMCHLRKNMTCAKCVRLSLREQQLRNELLDAANGN